MRAAPLLLLALLLAGCTGPADLSGAKGNSTGGTVGATALQAIDGCAAQETHESTAVVSSDAEWKAFWTKYCGASPGPPAVDFSRASVVAAFEGQRNTGGFTVRLTKATDTGAGVSIEELRTQPDPNCAVAQHITYPFAIAQAPRITKPPTFQITTTQTPC